MTMILCAVQDCKNCSPHDSLCTKEAISMSFNTRLGGHPRGMNTTIARCDNYERR